MVYLEAVQRRVKKQLSRDGAVDDEGRVGAQVEVLEPPQPAQAVGQRAELIIVEARRDQGGEVAKARGQRLEPIRGAVEGGEAGHRAHGLG